jgi:hypothetical protein
VPLDQHGQARVGLEIRGARGHVAATIAPARRARPDRTSLPRGRRGLDAQRAPEDAFADPAPRQGRFRATVVVVEPSLCSSTSARRPSPS